MSIDITPSPAVYLQLLHVVITESTNQNDRIWARKERQKMIDAGLVKKEGEVYLAIKDVWG